MAVTWRDLELVNEPILQRAVERGRCSLAEREQVLLETALALAEALQAMRTQLAIKCRCAMKQQIKELSNAD